MLESAYLPSLVVRVGGKLQRKLGLRSGRQRVHIGGRAYDFAAGTWRKAPDYDDAWLEALFSQTESLLDVGCNVGGTAVLACLAGVKRILLADATAASLSLAFDNVVRNFPGRVLHSCCAFISDADSGESRLYTKGSGAANSAYATHAVTAASSGTSVLVPNRTLDTIVAELGWKPELVKLDVEGAEVAALRGARQLAANARPSFFVEAHSNAELSMRDNLDAILQWSRDLNYTAHYLKEGIRLETPEAAATRGRCHLLLLPAGREYPSVLAGIPQGAPLKLR